MCSQTSRQNNPIQFPVSIIMESKPSSSIWQDLSWDAVGICRAPERQVGATKARTFAQAQVIEHGEIRQYIYSHFMLRLYLDECESYYHNLMSPQPGCYVIAREDEQARPVPFMVSMSFDEAHAYQEGDDLVYAVPIPAELYPCVEAYVVENYMPVKRMKRKRKDWNKRNDYA